MTQSPIDHLSFFSFFFFSFFVPFFFGDFFFFFFCSFLRKYKRTTATPIDQGNYYGLPTYPLAHLLRRKEEGRFLPSSFPFLFLVLGRVTSQDDQTSSLSLSSPPIPLPPHPPPLLRFFLFLDLSNSSRRSGLRLPILDTERQSTPMKSNTCQLPFPRRNFFSFGRRHTLNVSRAHSLSHLVLSVSLSLSPSYTPLPPFPLPLLLPPCCGQALTVMAELSRIPTLWARPRIPDMTATSPLSNRPSFLKRPLVFLHVSTHTPTHTGTHSLSLSLSLSLNTAQK
ncbi:hypothetical protein BGZ63DRAFT_181073 [Mariannaea sp. PMI_226]|nr:hypothetical protein BGZ63DRAFT_181073 [Mariannaea sp. PMI_226]